MTKLGRPSCCCCRRCLHKLSAIHKKHSKHSLYVSPFALCIGIATKLIGNAVRIRSAARNLTDRSRDAKTVENKSAKVHAETHVFATAPCFNSARLWSHPPETNSLWSLLISTQDVPGCSKESVVTASHDAWRGRGRGDRNGDNTCASVFTHYSSTVRALATSTRASHPSIALVCRWTREKPAVGMPTPGHFYFRLET